MRKGYRIKKRAYQYIVFIFIILLIIFAFYLSCKSKSPTEATSVLHNQVASQSTNNTTTSSSTTTTVQPGNSPTNTTTLITSRYLTTTSTRTTTSSSSTTSTTTSRQPTTSTTTSTALAECDIRWPRRPAQSGGFVLIDGTRYYHGDTLNVNNGDTIIISATVCNYGSVTWDGYAYIYIRLWNNGDVVILYAESFEPFPPGGSSSCHKTTTRRATYPFTVTQNGRLQITFSGEGANTGCNSEILINVQINE